VDADTVLAIISWTEQRKRIRDNRSGNQVVVKTKGRQLR
jgi:hypothetical protein